MIEMIIIFSFLFLTLCAISFLALMIMLENAEAFVNRKKKNRNKDL